MNILVAMMFVSMLATLLVMLVGVVSMGVGGNFSKRYSNRLMVARVTLQAITIILLALVIITR